MPDRSDVLSLRAEVEQWVAANLPVNWPDSAGARDWYRALADRGWTVPAWPVEFGGAGLDGDRATAIAEVLAAHDADLPVHHFVPLHLIGPALIAWGTDEQRQRYLPGIATGEDMWCQLYSEPGAGSDLASL